MANKRITDLPQNEPLSGTETFVIDQESTLATTGFNTVKGTLSSIQEFVLTDAPFFDVAGDVQIDGAVDIDGPGLSAAGSVETSFLTAYYAAYMEGLEVGPIGLDVAGDIEVEGDGVYLSAGEPLHAIFGTPDAFGNLNQVTSQGNCTTNSICIATLSAENIITAPAENTILIGESTSSILGGLYHGLSGSYSVIAGGRENIIQGTALNNKLSGAVIVGGRQNCIKSVDELSLIHISEPTRPY